MFKPSGLYGHIRKNNFKSILFLLGLPIAIEFLMVFWSVPPAIGLDQLFGDVARELGRTDINETGIGDALSRAADERYGRGWWVLLFNISLALGVTYFLHRFIIRAQTGSKPVERRSEPRLYNIIENLSITAGLPMPGVEIIETSKMNAYASGIGLESSVVTVTRGLVAGLDDNELQGVIAHELSHIKNHDARLMTIASTLLGAIFGLWSLIWRFVFFPTPLKVFVLLTMLPVAVYVLAGVAFIGAVAILCGLMLRMAISHSREFIADAGAVELTKDPDALISALLKISANDLVYTPDIKVQAMMFSWSGDGWFNVHPSIEARIKALVDYAGAQKRQESVCGSANTQAPVAAPVAL